MELVLYVIKSVVLFVIGALELAMFLRAILSWFPMGDGRFEDFLYTVTEPFIEPVRCIIDRFDSLRNMPIDISFFITFILLTLIETVLGMFM